MSQTKSKKEVLADPILRKGHAHEAHILEPVVCPYCKGLGALHNPEHEFQESCYYCHGEGEIYE